jgi:type IV secretion system protein VirB10
MSDDTRRRAIEPDETPDNEHERGNPSVPDVHRATSPTERSVPDRGMPDLGQQSGRPRAWWLTPLAIVVVAIVGAIWTVHGFLARHDAAAKARRDAALEQPTQGRTFGDESASAAGAPPWGTLAVSEVGAANGGGGANARPASVPAVVAAPSPMGGPRAAPQRSYYDAPLVMWGSGAEPVGVVANGPEGLPGVSSALTPGAGADSRATTRGQADSALGQALTPTSTPRVSADSLGNRSLILAQGAKIDCAGDTAFDSSEAGLSTCTVTKNVYSDDGRVVLIERGSQINSEYRSTLSPGQKRVFILSARIKTPNGVTVQIDSPAADALGRMGVGGDVDNHWGERIGAAMLLGFTQDAIGYLATRGGNSNNSIVFENTQQSGNDMATRVLDRTINIAPTLTQSQGAEFTIVVARDLDFSSVYALEAIQ